MDEFLKGLGQSAAWDIIKLIVFVWVGGKLFAASKKASAETGSTIERKYRTPLLVLVFANLGYIAVCHRRVHFEFRRLGRASGYRLVGLGDLPSRLGVDARADASAKLRSAQPRIFVSHFADDRRVRHVHVAVRLGDVLRGRMMSRRRTDVARAFQPVHSF
jgi:hypothetical protein